MRQQREITFSGITGGIETEEIQETAIGVEIGASQILHGEDHRGPLHQRRQPRLRLRELGLSLGDVGDVDQGHHQGRNLPGLVETRSDHQTQGTALPVDHPFLAIAVRQAAFEQGFQIGQRIRQAQTRDMQTQRGRSQVESTSRRPVEADQPRVPIEHQDGKLQGVIQVRVLLGQARQLPGLDVELLVQADQFLIGGLEFLVGGLQFLVGRLQFLVRGLRLLVQRLHLLVGGRHFLDQGLQMLARGQQFILERIALAGWRRYRVRFVAGRGFRHEQHQRQGTTAIVDRHHLDTHDFLADPTTATARRLAGLMAPMQKRQQFATQGRQQHIAEAQTSHPHRELEVALDLADAVLDVSIRIAKHRGNVEMLGQLAQQQLGLALAALGRRLEHAARGRLRRADRFTDLAEQALAAILGDEMLFGLSDAFGASQKQMAVTRQAEMENPQHLGLQGGVEINQHIPAGDQIETQEWRVADQVVTREHDHVAQVLAGLMGLIDRAEMAFEQIRRHFAHRRRRIDAASGDVERLVVDVGGENLYAVLGQALAEHIGEQHADRIRFLATRAPRDPDPDFTTGRLARADLLNPAPKCLESFAIAEKRGNRNQDVARQQIELARGLFHPIKISRQVATTGGDLAPAHPSHQGTDLVAGKIEPQVLAQPGKQPRERVRWRVLGILGSGRQQLRQPGRDFLGGQDMVHDPRLDGRARHAVIFRRFRLLRQRETARRLNRAQAGGAIRTGSRQDDPDRGFALLGRQRDQKLVDRRLGHDLGRRRHQLQPPFLQQRVGIGWHHIERAGSRLIALTRLLDRQRGLAAKDFHHHAAVRRRQMLKHDIRAWQIGLQVANQLGNGLKTPRRCANTDDISLAFLTHESV